LRSISTFQQTGHAVLRRQTFVCDDGGKPPEAADGHDKISAIIRQQYASQQRAIPLRYFFGKPCS